MATLIVGDVHLRRDADDGTATALAALIRAGGWSEITSSGDLIDLAGESVHAPFEPSIRSVLGAHDSLRTALAEHADRGGTIRVLGGNHDDELATSSGVEALRDGLGLAGATRDRVVAAPWFARLGPCGDVHVEHGHQYDPDNALPHSLTPPDPAWNSLGIGLMRRFIAPLGAHALVHSNGRAPLPALVHTFEVFGARLPLIVARYVLTAVREVARAGDAYPSREAANRAGALMEAFVVTSRLTREQVEAVAALRAEPTLSSARETFFRLYLDRVFALIVATAAGASVLAGGPGRRLALASATVLVVSILARTNRYGGRVGTALHAAADAIVAATGARTVVMGHVHEAVEHGSYINTGSFAFPGASPGRPYVSIDDDGQVARRFLPA